MGLISKILRNAEGGILLFFCPGCECGHQVAVNGSRMENGAGWQWNGSATAPTFSPSILIRGSEFSEKGRAQYDAWVRGETEAPAVIDSVPVVCHSFVREGRIEFLGDCTHKLAGKTVDLPDWEV